MLIRRCLGACASRLSLVVVTREGAPTEFDGIINDNDLELRIVDEATRGGAIECYNFYPGTAKAYASAAASHLGVLAQLANPRLQHPEWSFRFWSFA